MREKRGSSEADARPFEGSRMTYRTEFCKKTRDEKSRLIAGATTKNLSGIQSRETAKKESMNRTAGCMSCMGCRFLSDIKMP